MEALNGSDYFQLVLDRQMKRWGNTSNIGHLVLELAGPISPDALREKLQHKAIQNILNRRLIYGLPFQIPRWAKRNTNSDILHIDNANTAHTGSMVPVQQIIPTREPALQIHLSNETKATITLSWHHVLMDARGAEAFMALLADDAKINERDFLPNASKGKILDQLNHAKEAKKYIFEHRDVPVSNLLSKAEASRSQTIRSQIHFNENESGYILANAAKLVRFGRSPFYLASGAHAFKDLLSSRNLDLNTIFVPAPQDHRLRGSVKPVFSNQVSFFFYRLFPEMMSSVGDSTKALTQQMMNQIKAGVPKNYKDMMEVFRHMPLPLYDWISQQPTLGAVASFYFSDTGNSFKDTKTFQGQKINDITHLPPASNYPGLTLVFTEFNNRIKVSIVSCEAAMTKTELKQFKSSIYNHLTASS